MTGFDDFLRTLLFRKFCVGKVKFDFMKRFLLRVSQVWDSLFEPHSRTVGCLICGYSWKNGIWQSAQACW